jgi:hypothetical protein
MKHNMSQVYLKNTYIIQCKCKEVNMMHESSTHKRTKTLSQLPLNLHTLSPPLASRAKNYGSVGGMEAVESGAEERGVSKNREVSSSDSELSR